MIYLHITCTSLNFFFFLNLKYDILHSYSELLFKIRFALLLGFYNAPQCVRLRKDHQEVLLVNFLYCPTSIWVQKGFFQNAQQLRDLWKSRWSSRLLTIPSWIMESIFCSPSVSSNSGGEVPWGKLIWLLKTEGEMTLCTSAFSSCLVVMFHIASSKLWRFSYVLLLLSMHL